MSLDPGAILMHFSIVCIIGYILLNAVPVPQPGDPLALGARSGIYLLRLFKCEFDGVKGIIHVYVQIQATADTSQNIASTLKSRDGAVPSTSYSMSPVKRQSIHTSAFGNNSHQERIFG